MIASVQTNAIDPSVVITGSGEHWMTYGSAWDGIYSLKTGSGHGACPHNGDKEKNSQPRITAGNTIEILKVPINL